jgi:hypothetical protein
MSTHLVLNHHPHRFPATSSLSSLPHHYASSSSSHLFDYNPMSYQFDPSRSYPHTFNALPSNSVGDGYVGMLSVSNSEQTAFFSAVSRAYVMRIADQYTANYNLPSTLASPQIAAPQPVRSSHNLSAGSWGPGNTPSPVSSANSPTPTNSTLNYASGQSMRSPSPTAESPLGVNYPYGREEHLPGMPQPKSNRRPHIRSVSHFGSVCRHCSVGTYHADLILTGKLRQGSTLRQVSMSVCKKIRSYP